MQIENLETLARLERLNLSGNKIERIPESIGQLKRLKIFRISRNALHTIRDLKNLSELEHLTRFVFEENPISLLPHTRSYAIYHIPSLEYIDGREIKRDEREEAKMRFSSDELTVLRGRLSEASELTQEFQKEVNRLVEFEKILKFNLECRRCKVKRPRMTLQLKL